MSQIDDFLSGKTPESLPQSIDDFLGGKPKKKTPERSIGDSAVDVGKSVAGSVISAIGSIPTAIGRAVHEGGDMLLGMSMDEARAQAESEGQPDKALDYYERSNRLNPVSKLGGAVESVGTWLASKGDAVRNARSQAAKELARQSTPDGDLTKPSTWTMGESPSIEGVTHALSDVAGSVAPQIATAIATRGKSAATQIAMGGLSGAAQTGGAAIQEAHDYLAAFSDDKLREASPVFRDLLDKGYTAADARALIIRDAENKAGAASGVAGMLGGKATGAILGKVGERVAGGFKGIGAKAAVLGALGATEEGLQEVGEGVGTRAGINDATGMNRSLTDGSFGEFVLGAAGGTGFGAGKGVMEGVRERMADNKGGQTPPAPGAPAAPAQNTAPAAPAAAPVETEAEKALRTPTSMTALDRAHEITPELTAARERLADLTPENGYGPAFDQERQELASRADSLQAELDGITKTWPKTEYGAKTNFSTEAGARIEGAYALMDANDLVTSHDENLRANPLYPQEMQPRDRSRSASEMQVSGIVQKLDPARLGLSADAATGAPIVGEDGLVESGNARTIAMKRVYQANGQKAADYKQFLRDNAAQFGITPESVDAMEKPVLVRVRTTPVNRAEFARQANASTVAAMSPSEQAKSDASRIDAMDDLAPDDAGDFSGPASRPFIRRFMARLPGTEQAGMIDADGNLSTTGYTRVRNAILAKAYGDSPVLMRMVESLDDNLRNITKALISAAPKVAQMRDAIAKGARFDSDITPDLMAAVEELSHLKDAGTSISDALAQAGMFGDKYSPETRDLLQFLADNIRRPRRMADFIVAYMDALDSAGNPAQGSMFGDAQAPARQDLIKAAKSTVGENTDATAQDTQRGIAGENTKPGEKAGSKPADAPGSGRSDQGNGSARSAANDEKVSDDWVGYPKDSGTLGIPRAQMPQVKSDQRGALIQFLQARGIEHTNEEVSADSLKPTQAEYAKSKVAKHFAVTTGERSVLISSDNHVLDGHHQWMAALALGEPVKAIRFDAPIKELLAAVFEFPSVRTGEGQGADGKRAQAVENFKDAMGDLVMIATKHTRLAMVPEKTPNLMPTLIKLFDAAIDIVGTDLKAATKYVKEQLKANPDLKAFWNKITNDTYQKAAMQALEQRESASQTGQGSLFDAPKAAAPQGDLFADHVEDLRTMVKPKVAMIDGRPFDLARDNYKPLKTETFLPAELVKKAKEMVKSFAVKSEDPFVSEADRKAAEKLLKPLLNKAEEVAPAYTQAIIDIAKDLGIEFMVGPLKKMDRSIIKLATDTERKADGTMDIGQMRDVLRSTLVVPSYADAQRVLDAIYAKFKVEPGRIKNRTDADLKAKDLRGKTGFLPSGYGDVLVNVEFDGVKAEIQINVPEMIGAKMAEGHSLYEVERAAPAGSDLRAQAVTAQEEYYREAAAAAAARKDASLEPLDPNDIGKLRAGVKYSSPVSSDKPNTRPSGNLTNSVASPLVPNSQPGGNVSGTLIKEPFDQSVSELPVNGYTDGQKQGNQDAIAPHNQPGDQGQGPGASRTAASQGGADEVRGRSGGSGVIGNRDADTGAARTGKVGQAGASGVRRKNADGQLDQPRAGAGRSGVPAGRDIPAKSGQNYAFGPNDLTYEGSWLKKGEQNVDALELLNKLKAEGRQATREEQAILAKFVGWGSGELANNLFGPKLDAARKAFQSYDEAIKNFADTGRDSISNSNYRLYLPAFEVLQYRNPALNWYTAGNITKEMLEKAKPEPALRKWIALQDRIKAALTPEEFADASRSTQYAHYTSKAVVKSMWEGMKRMGFKGGSILEPGAGIGVFPGLMPAEIAANSIYTGIEFESTTGGILKQLFPDERVLVESFVDSKLPKNFYDVSIGNPPFSGTKILGDPEYAKHAFSLHDYFFAKSIDRTKPGGIVAYITSRYTMDKLDDKARKYLAERADLVGAIRLPQTAFKQNAGTEVVTDVIFLRKKVPGETFEGAKAWGKSAPITVGGNQYNINEYFLAHPEMVLGTHADTGSMYKDRDYTVDPMPGDIEAHFAKAIQNLPENIYRAERGSSAEAAQVREIDFNPKAKKEGNYYVSDAGVLMVREDGVGQRVELRSQADTQLIKDFVPLRDALKQAHYDQLNDGEWEASLQALQKAYKAFTDKNGQINQFTTKSVKSKGVDPDTGEAYTDEVLVRVFPLLRKLENDPDYTLVAALETINDDTGEIKPSAFLTDRVLGKPEASDVSTPMDALLSSLNDVGKVDISLIASRLNMDEADVVEALGTAIYDDPEGEWQTYDEYLSGNVKHKLEVARQAAQTDKSYERNVTALEAVQPAPKTPSQINIGIGANWVPSSVYEKFLKELAGVKADILWNERTRQWSVKEISGGKTMRATADHGTEQRNATDLLEAALTGRAIRITESQGYGKDKKTVFNAAATEAANQKLDAMKDAFADWVWKDADRTDQLVQIFNDKFNTTVNRSFEGSHLTLPGASKAFSVFDHVKRGAWRIIQSGNTYLAHAVGSGKTFQMVIAAMEQKRLGLIKKPMMVVPNHMLKQFAHEWQLLYPAARLMVADENNFHTDNRRRFVSRVALSDLDGVIITHSAFKLLDLDPEFKQKMINEQLDYMHAALSEAELEDGEGKGGRKSPRIKQIEKQIENLEQKLELAMSSVGKDTNVRFDELGVDQIFVDEAHEYRKLEFATARQVKGISSTGSARAFDLFMKSRYLEEKNPGRSLIMASGTPVTNTLAELYNVQRFMDRQALIDRGIEDFDSWASMFGRERTVLEPNAAGKYEPVTRFSKFVNVPELTQMFREFADVLTSDNLAALLGDKRPRVDGGSRTINVTPKTADYAKFQDELSRRVQISRDWKPTQQEPNNPDPMIRIIGDGRLAAIDMRFMDPSLPSDPDSKLNRMIDDVIKALKATEDTEYRDKAGAPEPNKGSAMMVFSDLGFGEGVAASRGFNARAWFEKRMRDEGIPMAKVAFMSDYKKSAEKLKLFKDVNAGRVRLLVGSSKNMGTGVNAQQRLTDLFHLDSPWYPADLEQREGRIVRQGNKNPLVRIHAYAAKGTYDENMWKMLASKQFFIDQALSGDTNLREVEDLDSQSQYDLAAAMVAEDPRILQLAGAKAEIEKMQRLYRAHEDQRSRFRSQYQQAKMTVDFNTKRMPEAEADSAKVQDLSGDKFTAKAGGKSFTERAAWAEAIIEKFKDLTARGETAPRTIGEISGFPVVFGGETVAGMFHTKMVLGTPDPVALVTDAGTSPVGMAMRAQNALADLARLPAKMRERITEAKAVMDALAARLEAPFPMAGMLADKIKEASNLEDQITADGKPKAWKVSRASDGVALDIEALNADEAVTKAISEKGGAPEDWSAIEAKDVPPEEGTKLSRGAGGRMDFKALDALVNRIKAKMPNMPTVHVLADPSKAPPALREYIIRQDAWDDVEGAMHKGELYMFASGLSDELRAEHVLAEHEAAHFGLRAVLGSSLKTAMHLVYAQNASVRRAVTELQKRGKLSNAEATEEVIVDIPTSELAKLKGWRKVVMMVRDWMQAHGYDKIAQKITDMLDGSLDQQQRADLFVAELVHGARDYVAGKSPSRRVGYIGDTRLSTTLQEDIKRQEAWLQREARARGFADIEDMLAKDYPVFEKLAELWRKKNPASEGVMLSRSVPTKAVFEGRIDALFAGEKAKTGTKVLDSSDILGLLGYPKLPLVLNERHLIEGMTSHPEMTAKAWKRVPEWIENPAAAYLSKGQGNHDRIVLLAPELFAGHPVVMVIEPNPGVVGGRPGQESTEQLLVTVFAKTTGVVPLASAAKQGNLLYLQKEMAPAISSSGGVQFPKHSDITTGRRPILTEKNLNGYIKANSDTALSRSGNGDTAAKRAQAIIDKKSVSAAPLDALAKALTKVTGVERLAGAIYDRAGMLLDRYTPEQIKAGLVSDYGVPQAVIDQRVLLQGRQRVQLRKAGSLIEKLSTLTREESRVAYEWMNMDGSDPKVYMSMMQGLPEESVKVLTDVQKMIDQLSREAVRMGQLSPEAYEANKFAYLRRSYAKHIIEQTTDEKAKRARVLSILGDQYKGRGLTDGVPMGKIKATDWWKRKDVADKADTALKGEKFIRLERRAPSGQGVTPLPGMQGKAEGKLLETVYWPAGETIPSKYSEWSKEGTWEVRDVKGGEAVMWRDFTKDEREKMGEVDEARFAIAKTLHGMIHDVEVGRYLEWLAHTQALKAGQAVPGTVVEASERYRDAFKESEWVQVPDTKIAGTNVAKYGKLAGRYIPGPVWNDLRQVVNGQFKPFGDTYAKLLTTWKTTKTALSPAVHMNNVMSNLVMADWHGVTAGHVAKALRIVLGASEQNGKGLIGRAGNVAAKGGIADKEAAQEIMARYADSGGDIGSWATQEIAKGQLDPLLESLESELAATAGQSAQAQVGVMSALQHAVMLRFPSAWDAMKGSKPGKVAGTEVESLLGLYQAEDDVFRLAAWLKAKEEGQSDIEAGRASRKSFLDYNINAPWIQAMRQSAWPFISFTYRAVPMLAEIAGKKPHKLMKLMMLAGALNALGAMLAGGDDDEERKLLPEEKAGRIWGMVPKLIRMPWNDAHGSPVYMDIRRFIPVGDVFDVGAGQSAIPVLPGLQPGGPLVLFGEIMLNKSAFTGKPITLETDTATEKAAKVADHLYKAFAPNILGLPGTYATQGVTDAAKGRTDSFGREMSTAQAISSAFGLKLGSYPKDVLRRNLAAKTAAETAEIDKNISQLKRQYQTHRLSPDEYREQLKDQQDKKVKLVKEMADKLR